MHVRKGTDESRCPSCVSAHFFKNLIVRPILKVCACIALFAMGMKSIAAKRADTAVSITEMRHWQHWENGRLWFGIYWVRTLMLMGFAIASLVSGIPAATAYIVAVVLPYNLFVQIQHERHGKVHRFLTADILLAAFGAVVAPAAIVATITCMLVSAVTGALGSGKRVAERVMIAGGVIVLIGGIVHHDTMIIAFAAPVAMSGACMARVIGYLGGRNIAASSRFEELLDGLSAAIFEIDAKTGEILYMNQRSTELAAHPLLTFADLLKLVHPDDIAWVNTEMRRGWIERVPVTSEVRALIDGEVSYFEHRSSYSQRGDKVRLRMVLVDVTGRKSAELELHHRALHDSLTDLPNRVLIRQRLDEATGSLESESGPHAVLILDLDSFKDVNDGLGHHTGDLLLIEIAERLRSVIRPTDVVARLGGDEFAVLLHNCDETSARDAANRIRAAISAPYDAEGFELHPDVSIGIAQFPIDATSTADLLRLGDVAMYRAKREGTGYAMYNESFDKGGSDRLYVLAELRRAIEQRELEPFFQPLVDSVSGTIKACEALVRWRHPVRGLLPAADFMPLVQTSGMSSDLAKYMLAEVLQQLRRWTDHGIALPTAVNLSANDLSDPVLMKWLFAEVKRTNLPAGLLTIELTEAELLTRAGETIESLTVLRDMGVTTAVDDFGTGCSSLVWLRDLPVNTVKIDRSFVENMCTDDRSHAIVKSTIELAYALDLAIIGEGVETTEIADALYELGCTRLQGYLYSRPLSAEAMSDALRLGLPRERLLVASAGIA